MLSYRPVRYLDISFCRDLLYPVADHAWVLQLVSNLLVDGCPAYPCKTQSSDSRPLPEPVTPLRPAARLHLSSNLSNPFYNCYEMSHCLCDVSLAPAPPIYISFQPVVLCEFALLTGLPYETGLDDTLSVKTHYCKRHLRKTARQVHIPAGHLYGKRSPLCSSCTSMCVLERPGWPKEAVRLAV